MPKAFHISANLFHSSRGAGNMPVSPDDTLPTDNAVSTSSTSAQPSNLTTEEVLEKFKQLNTDAELEEADGGEDEDDDGGVEGGGAVDGDGAGDGAGGEGGKKKKKGKKGKASKAITKLK